MQQPATHRRLEAEAILPPVPARRDYRVLARSSKHSAATLLLAQGVSPQYIAELLGHSQVSFSMQTYAHVLPEVQKQVATKMDEILEPKPVAIKPVSGKVGWLVSPLFCGAPGVTRTRDLLVRSSKGYCLLKSCLSIISYLETRRDAKTRCRRC